MVARILEQGHPVYYDQNTAAGLGGDSVNRQKAKLGTLKWVYVGKTPR